ncbi:hypothetical protein KKC83_01780 [Patescibacteria group bacterium]|nr:hypothetical protein [Candidatus Falkowbacteria bacterium]MBU3905570.1 hypothetical protein [Patescibacteria group bacterium]MBU4015683.1 hypothetical protein [Patescibacteria group bacterium]MBU4026255.1 hypothetical protein [Patescibacteria group bacterium]MBU4073088.1 hypothetical protein [Patescibacteria group bacterium]
MKKTIILAFALAFLASGCSLIKEKPVVITPEEAKAKVEEFINTTLMQPGKKAAVKEVVAEGGLYKMMVDIGTGADIESYASLDGTKFFPQAMEIKKAEEPAEQENTSASNSQPPAANVSAKSDKPVVEVFVMSHCPYGTQIEKGILPVVEALGDKIDFQLKFCDYAMHGEIELNEQLRQYCIQKEEPEKLIAYLSCFLQDGKYEPCLAEAGINNTTLQACVKDTDQQYKVTEKFNDKSTWSGGKYPAFDVNKADVNKYSISGSPGLVINGQKIQSNRDSASLLSVICSGFNEAPAECVASLSTATPSAGFGFGATGADSSGGCE